MWRQCSELTCEKPNTFHQLYDVELSIPEKIEKIATEIYGAQGVDFDPAAKTSMRRIEKLGRANLPICIAKTQYSLSDDPKKLGAPEGFRLRVRDVALSNGAGFIVALAGDIMTMPGLSRQPALERIDVEQNGSVTGIF